MLPNEEMRFIYPRNEVGNAGKVTGMYTYYSIMNRLLRKTISQRGGNPSDISLHAKNLFARLRPGGEDFFVVDYIWEEISENPQKICTYAPYLMELIEKATKTKFQTDVKHEPIRPKVPKHRRELSPHRYSENEDEIEVEEEGQPQQ